MKKNVVEKSDQEMLRDYPLASKTNGWFISLEEIANCFWQAKASDKFGRMVSKDSSNGDPDTLLEEIELIIAEVNSAK